MISRFVFSAVLSLAFCISLAQLTCVKAYTITSGYMTIDSRGDCEESSLAPVSWRLPHQPVTTAGSPHKHQMPHLC